MKGVKEFYNKTSNSWSEEWHREKEKSNVSNTFFQLFSMAGTLSPRILDAGSGLGYDCKILSNLGAKVTGIDFSENSIQISKDFVENCDFFIRDLTNSLVDLGKFDGILCLGVINYIDILDLRRVFENFSEILKKGGLLMISAKNGYGKDESKSRFTLDGEEYDLCFYDINAEQICSLMSSSLKLVDTFRFDDFSNGWKYYIFEKY